MGRVDVHDRNAVLAAVATGGMLLSRVSDFLKDDYDVVLAAVALNPRALWHANDR